MSRFWWAVGLTACGGPTASAPESLRDNVRVVYAAEHAVEQVVVTDADQDGDRIVLLRMSTGGVFYATLEISDDAGETWRSKQVRKEIVGELGGDSNQIGVHLQDGRVYLMLSRNVGSSWPVWAVFEVDTATGDTTEVVFSSYAHVGWYPERGPDGHLRYVAGHGLNGYADLDPATGTHTWTAVACQGMGCTAPAFRSGDGGATWVGYSQPDATHDVCVLRFEVASGAASQACVPRPTWPGTDYGYAPTVMFRGTTPYMTWSTVDQAYATAILPGDPPTVSETLALGPGIISPGFRTGTLVRPRYADFELIEGGYAPEIGNLARLTDAGAEGVLLPRTPCKDDDACLYLGGAYGYGAVHWVLPTGDGDYLVFYSLIVDEEGRETLFVARETPTFTPVEGATPP